jgi:hypothetical protein
MMTIGGDGSRGALGRSWRPATLAVPRIAAISQSHRALRSLLVAGMACAVLLGFGVAVARAELAFSTTFGSEGTGDGQFKGPQGIGVDQTMLGPTSGDIYVADTGNARVEQFDSAGNFIRTWGWGVTDGASSSEICTSACRAGLPGTGAGQLSDPTSIAVDSSSDSSQSDIYVGDDVNKVVDKFSPSGSLLATITGPSAGVQFTSIAGVAVDPTGNLWVADADEVYEFNSDGTLLTQFADNYTTTLNIAVDANEDVYLIRAGGEVEKWNTAARAGGNPVMFDPNGGGTGLAVDLATNNLYVDHGTSIDEWSASDQSLGAFGSGALSEGAQIAYDPTAILPGAGGEGALYVADRGSSHVVVFVPPAPAAPAVQPNSENATKVTATEATLNASVNPDGIDTEIYFEYGPTAAYGKVSSTPGEGIGSAHGLVAVTYTPNGLSTGTTYHFRVVAVNSKGTVDGPDATFTTATPMAPYVISETATGVASTAATLQATILPQYGDTHYTFEYGPTTAYGTQVPPPPGNDIGESDSEQSASFAITGLQANATYHFRVVATNPFGTTDGQDETFTTSPAIKIDSMSATGVTATAVNLSAKINAEGLTAHYRFEYGTTTAYGNAAPIPDGALNAAEGDQSVAVHLGDLQPNTKYYFRLVVVDSLTTEVASPKSFTTDATTEPTVLPEGRAYELVSPTEKNGGDIGGNPSSEFMPYAPSASGYASVSGSAITYSSFTSFGDAQGAYTTTQYLSTRGPTGWTTQNISPPLTKHVELTLRPGYHLYTPELTAGVLYWGAALLTPSAPEGEFENLYVRQLDAAPYELVTNVAPPQQTDGYEVTLEGASADLSHVVFDASAALVSGARANAYNVYEWFAGHLRLVSVLPGPGEVAAEGARAGSGQAESRIEDNAISTNGSRIFWTDTSSNQLYLREDAATTVKVNASQRTPSLGDGTALFRGATPDGSRVFFTDTTQLTNAANDNGGLYEYDVSSGKLRDLSAGGSAAPEVEGVVGMGENGLNVYFVARASLASGASAGGYNLYLSRDGIISFIAAMSSEDNADWIQPLEIRPALVTPNGEYLALVSQASLTGYDNTDANTGSADKEVFLYDAGNEHLSCVSCNPSGAQPVGSASVANGEKTGHTPRFITDDGQRVFFNSSDVLLPADTNGQQNVYEYENGTIHLISSGTGASISAFSDASPSGDDLFFTTRAQLVPQDTDENSDMYDARVGGGFPPPPASPEPCAGESCRGPLSAAPAPLSISPEASSPAPEALPEQPKAPQAPKVAAHKSKKPARHRAKLKKPARKSKSSKAARHQRKGSPRKRRHGGHNS